jgi:uncharacterized repeat protein (TIGR01451 family)
MVMIRLLIAIAALLSGSAAFANNSVALSSAVFVERAIADASGNPKMVLQEPKIVAPGDRLIFILSYHNKGPTAANSFVVTNPLPSAVAYQGTPDPSAEVSINGGKAWGALEALKVLESGQWRSARPEDVTHVRWALKHSIPVGAQGKLSFRGIVR